VKLSVRRSPGGPTIPPRQASNGQSLVEFAISVPLFLLVFLGILEFSWVIYGFTTVNHAANEAARRGMVLNRPKENYAISGNSSGTYATPSCNSATIAGTAACKMTLIPLSLVTVVVSSPDPTTFFSNTNVPAGNPVSVTVRYNYRSLTGFFNFPNAFTLTGYAQTQTQ